MDFSAGFGGIFINVSMLLSGFAGSGCWVRLFLVGAPPLGVLERYDEYVEPSLEGLLLRSLRGDCTPASLEALRSSSREPLRSSPRELLRCSYFRLLLRVNSPSVGTLKSLPGSGDC